MAREKEIPADVWARTCDLYFKQRRTADDIILILAREFKYKISAVTLRRRLNEIKQTFIADDDDLGHNQSTIASERRHANKLRRAVLGEVDPTKLSNKDKLQSMMDDTFVAFHMARRDNDVKKMDICLTSFSRGALAIAALERMGLEDGGKNGSPLPGVKLGSKQLGAHHRETGAYSLDPRSDAIEVGVMGAGMPGVALGSEVAPEGMPAYGQTLERASEMLSAVQLARGDSAPLIGVAEAREIAETVLAATVGTGDSERI